MGSMISALLNLSSIVVCSLIHSLFIYAHLTGFLYFFMTETEITMKEG